MYVNLDHNGVCLCMFGGCLFSMMFTCWESTEPIRYGVCNVYLECVGWFVVDGSFVC